mgnify:CR=1 FL=1
MKINSKMILITIIFVAIFIFIPTGKTHVKYYEYEFNGIGCGLCKETTQRIAGTYSAYLRLYGFPFQWTPKILPDNPESNNKRFESLNYKGIILDGITGVVVGGFVSFILFRKKKK